MSSVGAGRTLQKAEQRNPAWRAPLAQKIFTDPRAAPLPLSEADPLAPYAERGDPRPGWSDRVAEYLAGAILWPLRDRLSNPARKLVGISELANAHESALRAATEVDLLVRARGLRTRFRQEGFAPDLVAECFALVREVGTRTLGQRHYGTQLMAGWALLQGRLVEMATGEGKTISATLPACAVALAGYPVHVITVNDYLAKRDAGQMAPLYRMLGLSVGAVVSGMSPAAKREAYSCSVTYCTNKELAFDYLRDRTALGQRGSKLHLALEKLQGESDRDGKLMLRGLYFAIVDEADSVFIDEARTPLILAATAQSQGEKERYETALSLARELISGEDYKMEISRRHVTLTDRGSEKLDRFAEQLRGVWTSRRAREELIVQALSAMLFYQLDHHYVVTEGKVQIVDEFTGRVMADRSWERGLHQMIEAKEGCELTQQRNTLARITYQRLFRRYIRLSGMTGTGKEVAREIRAVYGLGVVKIPLYRPLRRLYRRDRLCMTAGEKWNMVADTVARIVNEQRRPVLIGTRSVKASEEVSAALRERGIAHALLNAKQDNSEAEIISLAGQRGRVTVATNMAGRGTDILLEEGLAEDGGLHVILTEYHESRRIDRQLLGRCARQGDPGSCEAIISLEDEIFTVNAPGWTHIVRLMMANWRSVPWILIQGLRVMAQFSAERRNAYIRIQNVKQDRRQNKLLAFSGKSE
jgi:preprotein translocase subunit SecA